MDMKTELIYLKNMQELVCVANIIDIKIENDKTAIILDQTLFYPQGGGQPFDNGVIENKNGAFKVNEVRFVDGLVYHIGIFEKGNFTTGEQVTCLVEKEKRELNTRLHSGGHLLDIGLKELDRLWKPVKGYHFPQGAYVEYLAEDNTFDESLIKELENKCNEIINRNIETFIKFKEDELVNGKPARIVYYGEFGIACGGTHCKNLKDIGKMEIRKIKKDKEIIRISYSVLP